MAAGGALGALFGPGKSMKAGFGMFAIGAGIGGFFAGLSLGAAGIDILNTDASSLVPVMKNVAEGLGAFASNPGALAVSFRNACCWWIVCNGAGWFWCYGDRHGGVSVLVLVLSLLQWAQHQQQSI